jgi:hypothetical protein
MYTNLIEERSTTVSKLEIADSSTKNQKPTMDQTESAPTPEYTGVFSFFRRHWNGDYSLGRSYWVNNILVTLFVLFLGALLRLCELWLNELPVRYASVTVLAFIVFSYIAWFWAIHGTWLSATKHTSRGGRQGWATTAKVMICLGVFRVLADLGNSIPVISEHVEVALGKQFKPKTELTVLAGGQSILLFGGINEGSALKLESILNLAPSVNTIVLESPGGWIREGEKIADIIRRRGLNTYVDGTCASACTIAFLAGKERTADPNAKIGFHASHLVGDMDTSPTTLSTAQLRNIYRNAGIQESFISKALDTPYADMWFPSVDELMTAHVLTRRSSGGETAILATALVKNGHSKETLAEEFKKIEIFSVMAQRMPQDFDHILNSVWVQAQTGATDAEVITAARNQVIPIIARLAPLATDQTLVAYHKVLVEEMEILLSKDPSVCVEMMFPTGKPVNLIRYMPKDLAARELELSAQILREADFSRAIKPSETEIEEIALVASKDMTPKQITIISNAQNRSTESADQVCGYALTFLKGLGSIPTAQRGRSMRILFSMD